MNSEMRKPLLAGNYKMNLSAKEIEELLSAITPTAKTAICEVAVAVPTIYAQVAKDSLKDTNIALALQNVHFAEKGAYTGETSVAMAQDMGVRYVLVGHSERREGFGDTDEVVAKKVRALLDGGLSPILCVGESLEQQQQGQTLTHVFGQIKSALDGVTPEEFSRITIAYEPIWAIGTGLTATPELAGEVCGFIRGAVSGLYGGLLAEKMRILYGGSMNSNNALALLAQYDIDGGLIGSASLKAEEFNKLIHAFSGTI